MSLAIASPETEIQIAHRAFDPMFTVVILLLLSTGLIMVTSASMPAAERIYGDSFYFFWRHLMYLGMGVAAACFTLIVPMGMWSKSSRYLLIVAFVLLIVVLVPGIGKTVNGSTRWINFGFITFQASELVKIFVAMYLADFVVRKEIEVQAQLRGFLKPVVVLVLMGALLLMEPDFGSTFILFLMGMGILFLGGARLSKFMFSAGIVAAMLAVVLVSEPYRLKRLTSFMDPWADPYGSGYQLIQSLIAIGRGGWAGEGLGNSIQKLSYLPEAHTDFVFAVMGEELGVVGLLLLLAAYILLVIRGMQIGHKAQELGDRFSSLLVYGLLIGFSAQAFINMGANCGLLPTKGLTLPLVSYGGSSILITCVSMGLIARVHYENVVRTHMKNTSRAGRWS